MNIQRSNKMHLDDPRFRQWNPGDNSTHKRQSPNNQRLSPINYRHQRSLHPSIYARCNQPAEIHPFVKSLFKLITRIVIGLAFLALGTGLAGFAGYHTILALIQSNTPGLPQYTILTTIAVSFLLLLYVIAKIVRSIIQK